MREWLREFLYSLIMIVLIVATVFCFAVPLSWGLSALLGIGDLHNTWPESAEFSQLMGGQERFSEHATNVDGLTVVVDHETGVQYPADGHGMTALLDADGTPLRVKEATDD